MTDLENLTMDYWWAAKALRTGKTVTGRAMTGKDTILAHTSLIEIQREATTVLHDRARELCLARGIVAVPVERHDGGSAA